MDLLKKRTQSHKFLVLLSHQEINCVLERHIPHLRSIQILKSGTSKLRGLEYQVLMDEYLYEEDLVVEAAKENLKKEFLKKIPKNIEGLIRNECLKTIAPCVLRRSQVQS